MNQKDLELVNFIKELELVNFIRLSLELPDTLKTGFQLLASFNQRGSQPAIATTLPPLDPFTTVVGLLDGRRL
jgi:hypothetical protein